MGSSCARTVLLLLALTGCARWQPQGLTPSAVIEKDHPARVRVTRRDSSQVELMSPVLRGDSIQGRTRGGSTSVPLSEVSYLSLRRGNNAGVLGVVGIGVAAGLIGLMAATWD